MLLLQGRGDLGAMAIMGTLHYRSLTIRLFSVISRTLVGGVLPLCSDAVGIFCSTSRLSHYMLEWKILLNNTQTVGFDGFAVRLVVWTPLIILTLGCEGISLVEQKSLRDNKQQPEGGRKNRQTRI